ncbi:MAG: DUF4232 domain-containing protein [Streptosporangiaceae bacterium]
MRIRIIAAVIAAIGLSALGLTAASAAPAATSPPPATTAGLRVWIGIGPGESAAGSTYYPLEFTNVSGHTVTIRGFPGVSAVNASGQLGSPAGWEHTTAPVTVTLANGATAHTTLQITDVYNFGGLKVAAATALRIYPPNQKTPTYIDFSFGALVKKGPVFLHVGPITPGTGIPGGSS